MVELDLNHDLEKQEKYGYEPASFECISNDLIPSIAYSLVQIQIEEMNVLEQSDYYVREG